MKPRDRMLLNHMSHWIDWNRNRINSMEKELRRASEEEFPAEFTEIHTEVVSFHANIQSLSAKLMALFEADQTSRDLGSDEPLDEAEKKQLLALNRSLGTICPLLRSAADEVTQRLVAKVADQNDPMYDYEIDVHLAFILREDDQDYEEDGDNILTVRKESLKLLQNEHENSAALLCEVLKAEQHCWHFHDLYDHDYGIESPSLSLHDCLRIGKVLVDVGISQQYSIDVRTVPVKTTN